MLKMRSNRVRIGEVAEAKKYNGSIPFGRMNPTAGHKKLVNTIMKQNGDHYF